jgi:hypothetical protein
MSAPAHALEITIAEHAKDIESLRRDHESTRASLVRIEEKIDGLKDGWNTRMFAALGAAVSGLCVALFSFWKR